MLAVNVNGGTNAGSRIVKQHKPWKCRCHNGSATKVDDGVTYDVVFFRAQHGDRYSCPDCGARRP